jgi:DNA-binding transcriptional ArsR family regulator
METKDAKSSNYFGTFLETVRSGTSGDPENAPPSGDALPMQLIEVVKDNGPFDASSLQVRLGVDLSTFSKTLDAMTDAGLVEVKGEAGHETVSLTGQGEMLAAMHETVG